MRGQSAYRCRRRMRLYIYEYIFNTEGKHKTHAGKQDIPDCGELDKEAVGFG